MNLDVPRPAFSAVSILLMLLAIAILPSCGSSSGSSGGGGGGSSNTPKRPILDSISPRNVTIGGPAFTLTLTGAQFSPSDIVLWTFMGTQTTYTPTFVSSTELTISVPASAIANPGRASILVQFQGEKLYSASQSLGILPPIPFITSLSPSSIPAGSLGFTLTVNGSNFLPNALESVEFYDADNESGAGPYQIFGQFISSTQFTIQIPATAIAYPGTAAVAVHFGGVGISIYSNTVAFQIIAVPGVPPAIPTITTGIGGVPPNGASSNPVVSDNGRFVSFASQATNLVAGGTNFPQAYVTDTCLGAPLTSDDGLPSNCAPATLLVSAEPAGSPANPVEGNGPSTDPSIGNQGAVVTGFNGPPIEFFGFLSAATDLVLPNTTSQQAYFRQTCYLDGPLSGCTPQTVLVSVSQNNVQANGPATDVVMDLEGCNGVFVSSATNVIAGLTIPGEVYFSQCSLANGLYTFAPLSVVSESNAGVPGDQGGIQPALTNDLVAFASTSTNLTSVPNGGFQQIYLRNTCIGVGGACATSTTMVSVDGSGNALPGNGQNPSLSVDGRFVSFTTQVPSGGGSFDTIYRYDTCISYATSFPNCTPSTATISVGSGGTVADGSSDSGRHALSVDGRFVAFHSSATNLVAGGNPAGQVFVRDTCSTSEYGSTGTVPGCTPTTNMVSINNGVPIGGSQEAISADGHFVVFVTTIGGIQQVVLAYTGF